MSGPLGGTWRLLVVLLLVGCTEDPSRPALEMPGPARVCTWERVAGPVSVTPDSGIYEQAHVWRTPAPGGWLVVVNGGGVAPCFVPDPEHVWLPPAVESGR